MWKLDHIQAVNLCAFRQLNYILKQGVTTLVFGDNRDNESQRSNGSGKSALIEAIAVGITGSPLRKVRGEEIINDAADECCVLLEFSNSATSEVFSIERRIPRKGASTVCCRIVRDGKAVSTDEAAHASVDAYNRYILEKLGITREELFNTFILSKHKYQDFLSASDTQKKEIINRFSNGILVDRAIEKVAGDIAPVEKELQEAALEIAGIDGRIGMLSEQIEQEESAAAEKARSRGERMEAMRHTIAEKNALIGEKNSRIAVLQERAAVLEASDEALQTLEEGEDSVEGCQDKVRALFVNLSLSGLTDWDDVVERKRKCIADAEAELQLSKTGLSKITLTLEGFTADYERLKSGYAKLCAANQEKARVYDTRMGELAKELAATGERLNGMRRRRRELVAETENLKGQLSGTICCPACRHEFLLSDETFDIASAKKELAEKQDLLRTTDAGIAACNRETESIEQKQDQVRSLKRALTAETSTATDELSRSESAVRRMSEQLHHARQHQSRIEREIADMRSELEGVRRKLFDEAFALVDDACRATDREVRRTSEEIRSAESAIAMLRETMQELSEASASETILSLKTSLKQYRSQLSKAVARQEEAGRRLGRLQEQQERFVQFKSYLAGTKIEALNRITNEFLESIGSDIRLRLSGFTLLKTGKIREKISASLIRDGVDCGSFGKFSQGEAARVHLATILAMQRLVNGGCETDKGLDLLIIDELLDAMDESGLTCTFAALNRLGITSLVVSHGNVTEGYPYRIIIVKENGESQIG